MEKVGHRGRRGAFGAILERRTLLAIIGVALAAWAFAAIFDEVREGDTLDFDHRVLLAFRVPGHPDQTIGPPWVETSVRDVTALGSNLIISFIALSVAGYLALARKPGVAAYVLVAIVGAMLLGDLVKHLADRPRPELVPHAVEVFTTSFPSGHATDSAAAYLTLGALTARLQRARRLKVYALSLAILVTLAVGLSRLYLGVHWPTDVLAGWTLGGGWALLCWTVVRVLQHRGHIDAPPPEPGEAAPA